MKRRLQWTRMVLPAMVTIVTLACQATALVASPTPRATPTPAATSTPIPTSTPTLPPTATPTITPTPRPDISGAVLTLADLPTGFQAVSLADYGISKEAFSTEQFQVENLFSFVHPQKFQMILGYNFLLTRSADRVFFDASVSQPDLMLPLITNAMSGAKPRNQKLVKGLDDIGDARMGMSVLVDSQGIPMQTSLLMFRRGVIGELVMSMVIQGQQPNISLHDLGAKLDQHAQGSSDQMALLVASCKQEGTLILIATPPDWANYGEIFDLFETKYGVKINSLNENAGSADELAAIKASKANKSPDAPDIVDIGYAYTKKGLDAGYYQPYKVSNWDKIPDTILGVPAKDPDGYWTGGYYGVMAMLSNDAVVKNPPQNWADLLKPEYKGQVALSGDPRNSNQGVLTVYAAALANGGSLDNMQPGLDYFKKMNDAGNLVPVVARPATITGGTTPIALAWDYLLFGYRDSWNGNPAVTITYPSPTIASMYVQAISAYAPHPNCAKLWMEMLHSDEGQLAWLKGYVHGVNQADMEARGVIPAELKEKMPTSDALASAASPSAAQLDAAKQLITAGWMKTVGVQIAPP